MRRARDSVGRDVERLLRDGVDPPGGDGSLLRRFLEARDETAFEAIVDRHGSLVLSLCRRYLRDPADIEDAFQATFLVLVRKGTELRESETLAGWLYAVARRVAVRARSNVLKRRSREGDRESVHRATAQEKTPVDDSSEVLDGELSRLPEKYRAPLVLCYLRGKTHDQAAAELGWPVGTVRSRMAKGRSILHDRLSRRGLDATACLTAARADLATVAVPSSLVAATASAAGRFAGYAAGLGWIWRASPSSTTGPAALAEGVISTMSTTPWKLLGFAFLSTGLTAGALALTAGPSSNPVKPEEPPKSEAQSETKSEAQAAETTLKSVEARLSEVEKKLDRMLRLMEKSTAATDLPKVNGVLEGVVEPAAPRSFEPKGLREIEAELINIHQRYQYTEKLVERAVVSKNELNMVVAPARLLVARLREMEAEALKEEETAQRSIASYEQTVEIRYEIDKAKQTLQEATESAKRAGFSTEDLTLISSDRERMSRLLQKVQQNPERQAAFRQYQQAIADLHIKERQREMSRLSAQNYEERKARTHAIQKLVNWAREHFKNVELTIDDVEKSK